MSDQRIYTINEFAVVYRIGRTAVQDAIRRGEIKAVTIGSQVRIPDPGWRIMRYYSDMVLPREHFIRTKEAMSLLNVKKTHIRSLVKNGALHPVLERGLWRFSLEDLLNCVKEREIYRITNPKRGIPKKLTRKKKYALSRDWLPRNAVIDWARRTGEGLELKSADTILIGTRAVPREKLEP